MTVSVADLRDYIGVAESLDTQTAKFLAQSVAMVDAYIDGSDVPEAIYDQVVLEVGKELWHRKGSASGISQYATTEAPAVRLARDPMTSVYPILARWVKGGIA